MYTIGDGISPIPFMPSTPPGQLPMLAKIFILACGWIFFIFIFTPSIFTFLFGYHVGMGTSFGEEVAKKIAKEHRDPRGCRWIIQFDLGPGPSQSDVQDFCLFRLAELIKDPRVCELLIPNVYTMNCIGNVWDTIDAGDGCNGYNGGQLVCDTGSGSIHSTVQTKDCKKYDNIEMRDWCYTERTRTLPGVNECDQISPKQRRIDECLHVLAFKEKDSVLCEKIQGAEKRLLCEERIKIWKEYPGLR